MNGTTRLSLRLASLATCSTLAMATFAVPSALAAEPAPAVSTQADVPPLTDEQRAWMDATIAEAHRDMQKAKARGGDKGVVEADAVPVFVAIAVRAIIRYSYATYTALRTAAKISYTAFVNRFEQLPGWLKWAITTLSGFEMIELWKHFRGL